MGITQTTGDERWHERIPFRLLQMQCCGGMICHVNHRFPMYCSNCGQSVYPAVRGWVLNSDMDATLSYKVISK